MDGPLNPALIEAKIKEEARQYADETLNNPSEAEYLLIHNAMMKGWEMGIRHAISHMREKGISFNV